MKVNPFSSQNFNKQNTSFKRLVFHDDARAIITHGDPAKERDIIAISKDLAQTNMYDLHVKPLSRNKVSYFWTRNYDNVPVMDRYIFPFKRSEDEIKKKIITFTTANPCHSDNDEFIMGSVKFQSIEKAALANRIMNRTEKSPIDKLEKYALITRLLESAEKITFDKIR